MNRDAFKKLLEWKESASKKPILLRGARQVGKSWLARELGKTFEFFIEINFEQKPALKKIFDLDLDPARIARDIQIASGSTLVAGRTLLFLDETQECPNALKALRYFYEQMPDLHVLAAGSLLDFTIEEIGLPVGRVSSLYLHPMSFGEFLDAAGHEKLRQEIINDGAMSVSSFLHLRLMSLLGQYLAVGGMPESVAAWIETRDFNKSAEALSALADAYRQDFSKYSRTKQQKNVELIFSAVPRLVGKKFVFSHVSPEIRSRELKPAVELLAKAGVINLVANTGANGIPLASEADPSYFKAILLDVALMQNLLGSNDGMWIVDPASTIINKGAVAKAFVGQELLAYSSSTTRHNLYFWARDKRGASAEVDYVVETGGAIMPVEVKSGSSAHARSIRVFMKEKNSPAGVCFTPHPPRLDGRIKHVPVYAVEYLPVLKAAGTRLLK